MDRDEAILEQTIEEAIDKAIVLFDTFGWTYWNTANPTRFDLSSTIRDLIRECDKELAEDEDREDVEISTGRFSVMVHGRGDIDIKLDLSSYYHPERKYCGE